MNKYALKNKNGNTNTLHHQIDNFIIKKTDVRYKCLLGGVFYDRDIAGNPREYTRC